MPRKSKLIEHINITAGERLKVLRVTKGLSREQLAKEIDVTHQQLQKYEKGTNGIGLGRLVMLSKILEKPLSYFLDQETIVLSQHSRMCIETSRNFLKLNAKNQTAVNNLIRTLVEE